MWKHLRYTSILTTLFLSVLSYEILDTGKPVYRRPGITEKRLPWRIDEWGQLTWEQARDPALVGYAATEDCGLIGEWIGITWPTARRYPYLVIDCRARNLPAADGPWEFAVEVEQDEWYDNYDWSLWVDRVPVVVWRPIDDRDDRAGPK